MTPTQLSEKFEKEWGSRLNRNLWHFYELKSWIEDNAKQVNEEYIDDLQDVFNQSCYIDGKYDHGHHLAYEIAQHRLIEAGRIKEEDCYRD